MKIIIPMAGLGSRFREVADKNPEYNKPKPFIMVMGYPMVRWATGSLPFVEHPGQTVKSKLRVKPEDMTFVILKEHDHTYEIAKKLKELYSDEINMVILDKVTRGAAETVYKAKQFINPEEDLIISDSDHFFKGEYLADLIMNKDPDTAGIIPVFIPPNDGIARWSYSLTEPNSNIIIDEGEKDVELMNKGAYANIGAYYFSKGKYFLDAVEEALAKNDLTGDEGKKEFYVAPLYKKMIDKSMTLQAAITPEVWGLGTPKDLEYFLNNCQNIKFYQ